MVYIDFAGREQEDLEMDNMRRDRQEELGAMPIRNAWKCLSRLARMNQVHLYTGWDEEQGMFVLSDCADRATFPATYAGIRNALQSFGVFLPLMAEEDEEDEDIAEAYRVAKAESYGPELRAFDIEF